MSKTLIIEIEPDENALLSLEVGHVYQIPGEHGSWRVISITPAGEQDGEEFGNCDHSHIPHKESSLCLGSWKPAGQVEAAASEDR